jgi:diguanylate cyclase (GGDEF)-like protein
MVPFDVEPGGAEERTAGETGIAQPAAELREENDRLRALLEQAMATAAANERIWRNFLEIERVLFRTRRPEVLADELLREIRERFGLECVVLFLSHQDIRARFFPKLEGGSEPAGEGIWLLALSEDRNKSVFGQDPQPLLLSREDLSSLGRYLPLEAAATARSGVLLPLYLHHVFFGSLFLGSADPHRYPPHYGTDLLEQLAAKIALCLENCLAYEQVRSMSVRDRWTGLLNFFQIHSVLEREYKRSAALGESLAALVIDLDFHQNSADPGDPGPKVMDHAARLLEQLLPDLEGYLGRCGGDEFLLILPDAYEDEAREAAGYVLQAIRKNPLEFGNTAILIRPTIGLAVLDSSMKTPHDLLDAAYSELYRIKGIRPECAAPTTRPRDLMGPG